MIDFIQFSIFNRKYSIVQDKGRLPIIFLPKKSQILQIRNKNAGKT